MKTKSAVCKLTKALGAFANISYSFYINRTLLSETEHIFESFLHTQNWISVLLPHSIEGTPSRLSATTRIFQNYIQVFKSYI